MAKLLLPSGRPAKNIDRTMLLNIWAKHFSDNSPAEPVVRAGIGKPSFPVSEHAAYAGSQYWYNLWAKAHDTRRLLRSARLGMPSQADTIAENCVAIDYGDPQGEPTARQKMAKALTKWYETTINADNVLFTVGGAAALHLIFCVLNKRFQKDGGHQIITPFPHYSLYAQTGGKKNNLYPIFVMNEPGYQLTANLLEKSIEQAKLSAEQDNQVLSAFLLCEPNNPLGTMIDVNEMHLIADVLRKHPDLLIIIDEAYIEMRLESEGYASLLQVAPDLKKQLIILRSATKGLSSAGERMALLMAFDDELMEDLVCESINLYGHSPVSLQYIYAEAMENLNKNEIVELSHFYKKQVAYVIQRLHDMEAAMPDPHYKVTGTFYVIADFSDFLNLPLPEETKCVLNKSGCIETDEEIVYYLLCCEHIMLAPLSYFGCLASQGYLRITCSAGIQMLSNMLDKLENALKYARRYKIKKLLYELQNTYYITELDHSKYKSILNEMSASELKKLLLELEKVADRRNMSVPYQIREEHAEFEEQKDAVCF